MIKIATELEYRTNKAVSTEVYSKKVLKHNCLLSDLYVKVTFLLIYCYLTFPFPFSIHLLPFFLYSVSQ